MKPTEPLGPTITSSGNDSPASAQKERSGELVGHYRLSDLLGEGGMGVVYRASDEKLGRPVAIKFLQRSDEKARARFLREARTASALDHPNIGTVYEIGESAGAPFIVMALYEGETLRARIKRGKIPESEVIAIARQLCAALQAAHAAGIVHRDLKPANVMLLADGTLKLLDFGLAKLTSVDESSLTHEGAILGTLAYMAPEQLKSAEVDARADLWALGAMLYEMLSGNPPFGAGPAAAIVGRILSEDPPRLAGPKQLVALAEGLLRKDVRDRIATASHLGELLASGAHPPRRRRRKLVVGLAIPSALVLFIVAIAMSTGSRQSGGATPDLTTAPLAGAGKMQEELAKARYESAVTRFDAKDYAAAAADFEAAYTLSGDAVILYNAAQSYRQAHQLVLAKALFERYLHEAPNADNRDDVRRILEEIRPDNADLHVAP